VAVGPGKLTAGDIGRWWTGKLGSRNRRAERTKFALRDFSPGDQSLLWSLVGEATALSARRTLTTSKTHIADCAGFHEQTPPAMGRSRCSRWQGRTLRAISPDRTGRPEKYWLVIPCLCETRNILALREAFQKHWASPLLRPIASHRPDMAKLYREKGRIEEDRK